MSVMYAKEQDDVTLVEHGSSQSFFPFLHSQLFSRCLHMEYYGSA